MRSFTVLTCLLGLAGLAESRMVQAHKGLAKRQASSISVSTSTTATTAADASPTTSDDGGLLDTLLNGRTSSTDDSVSLGQATLPNPLLPPTLSSSSSSTTATASSSSSAATTSTSTSTASARVGTVIVTSTQSTPSSSASAAAQSSAPEQEESSGVGKKTLIIVIAVASSIGLVVAIWTILRKWKFSPSRKFEERLNPIDWTPEQRAAEDEKLGLGRSPSLDSSARRQNSWGSARGAAMSEVSGYSRPAPSGIGSNGYPGYPPSTIPPSYTTHADQFQHQYPSQQSLDSNPYEYASVTRQGTQVNGGRYGDNYR